MKNPGLTGAEAQIRLQEHGPNALPLKEPVPVWRRFLKQFQSPLIYILLIALVVDAVLWYVEGASGLPIESIAVGIILLLNAGLGVYQENKSESALAKLHAMTAPLVWVRRDGKLVHLAMSEIVPGDVIRIEAGDRISADGILTEESGAMVDESLLTGESVPAEKGEGAELFSGTLLVRGKGYMEVRRTGEKSAMGRLAAMLRGIQTEKTPLERRMEIFAGQIARAVLGLVALVAIGGVLLEGVGQLRHVLLFAVALAVAAVPEGLPAVLTFTLALGVERMARKKAVVRRLSAVESLGSVTVIATDKTGTLTENRMFVKNLDSPDSAHALRAMILANDAEEAVGAGDPLELALLEFARRRGQDPEAVQREFPRRSSRPFDSAHKFMQVVVGEDGASVSYLKGAPEVLLARSRCADDTRRVWTEKADAYAREGFRVLALARRDGQGDDDLDFLGLVLLWDPPRPEVSEAIRSAQDAGIRIVMVTGDHPATAVAVAHAVGIRGSRVLTGLEIETMPADALRAAVRETSVFARVAPEHKLRLVEALKADGEIVAMTGDGVNDAPALKRSDVGIAMGQRGSDVSREAADLVLMDNNFATIVAAIEQGRNIYANIQKFIRFLFLTNFAEVSIVVGGAAAAALMGLRDETGALLLPLTAVQLLWVNIVTDGLPALALGLDRDYGVMKKQPRDPKSPLLDRTALKFILGAGFINAAVGGALLIALPQVGFSLMETRTAIFLHITLTQLLYTYPVRRLDAPPRFNGSIHLAVCFGIALQLLTVTIPSLRTLLALEPPTFELLTLVLTAALLTWGMAEVFRRTAFTPRQTRQAPA